MDRCKRVVTRKLGASSLDYADAIEKRALAQELAAREALGESAMVINRVVARDECTLKLPNTRPMRDEEGWGGRPSGRRPRSGGRIYPFPLIDSRRSTRS